MEKLTVMPLYVSKSMVQFFHHAQVETGYAHRLSLIHI